MCPDRLSITSVSLKKTKMSRHDCVVSLEHRNATAYIDGCNYSLDWNTGLDYWTGLLDCPLSTQVSQQNLMHG